MNENTIARGEGVLPAADGAAPVMVSIIMPVKNEGTYVDRCVKGALNQDYPAEAIELIVADGRSTDGTRERLDAWAGRDPRVRVIDNAHHFVSHGLNAAIRAARGKVIIRMDAHTMYPPDYVRECVRVMTEMGADNVGGSTHAVGESYVQSAIALAFHSPFSSGFARFHDKGYEGWVDTVPYGCWRVSTLERLGGFDEELVRNQDDELNLRLIRSGGRIWQSRSIRSRYYPRPSLWSLCRQYSQYGYWKVRVIQKHRMPASIRHLVPGAFVAVLMLLALLTVFDDLPWKLLLSLLALYGGLNLIASVATCWRVGHWRYLPLLPLVFVIYHVTYGFGFLRGLIDFILLRRGASRTFTQLSRDAPQVREHP